MSNIQPYFNRPRPGGSTFRHSANHPNYIAQQSPSLRARPSAQFTRKPRPHRRPLNERRVGCGIRENSDSRPSPCDTHAARHTREHVDGEGENSRRLTSLARPVTLRGGPAGSEPETTRVEGRGQGARRRECGADNEVPLLL